jgi:adenine-specific DNA-methyltransferase
MQVKKIIPVKSSESVGIATELILCNFFKISFNTKRKNCEITEGLNEIKEDIYDSMRQYFENDLILSSHIGHKNDYYDFVDTKGLKVSVKTNITGNKVCPQNIGQVSIKRFREKTNFSEVFSSQDFKKIVFEKTEVLIVNLLENLFCCDTTIHFHYNLGKVLVYSRSIEDISISETIKFSFSRTLENWNESNTVSVNYDGGITKSFAEFQVHNNRDCVKSRFNSETLELLVAKGLVKGVSCQEFLLNRKYDIKIEKKNKEVLANTSLVPYFKTFNYIGSKFRLLDFITNNIKNYTGKSIEELGSFGDLFSGSGVVSRKFLEEGANKVISCDLQYYSVVVSSVFTDTEIDRQKVKEIIGKLNNLPLKTPVFSDFIYYNYTVAGQSKRNYLTPENGLKVDAIRKEIESLRYNGLSNQEFLLLLKILLFAVVKVSNTASVFGAYLKETKASAKNSIVLETNFIDSLLPSKMGITHECYQRGIYESSFFTRDLKVTYLDPPYNSRNYSNNYHLLETIARYDSPVIRGKTGLRETEEESKIFCLKSSTFQEFEKMVSNIKSRYLFISYSSQGILSKEQIIQILNKFRSRVIVSEHPYQKFKSNENCSENLVTEYLFCSELLN